MQQSFFCAEAEYAYHLKKPIIPIRMEAGYMPDGWLGLLCCSHLFFNYCNSAPESEWKKLYARLRKLTKNATTNNSGLH